MRQVIASGVAAAAALVLVAAPAAAHNQWEPETAAPGSVVDLTLLVGDEQPDAGTTMVELRFPAPITVAALPAVPGWTATPVDGEVGGPASGVTWAGGPAPGDVELPIRLGPLPNEPGRLQFKTVQTYDNGAVARWIDDWPEGGPEPVDPAASRPPPCHRPPPRRRPPRPPRLRPPRPIGRHPRTPTRTPTATLCPSWSPRW
jgi:uncharacterized protein YcnI